MTLQELMLQRRAALCRRWLDAAVPKDDNLWCFAAGPGTPVTGNLRAVFDAYAAEVTAAAQLLDTGPPAAP